MVDIVIEKVGKGENAGHMHFTLFSVSSKTLSFPRVVISAERQREYSIVLVLSVGLPSTLISMRPCHEFDSYIYRSWISI